MRLTYQTRAWATDRLESSGPRQDAAEPKYVEAISLQDFKLTGPEAPPDDQPVEHWQDEGWRLQAYRLTRAVALV